MFNSVRRGLGLTLALVAVAAVFPADAFGQAEKKVDVTGKWTFTVTTDAGSGTPTLTFKQQGDSISGHYSSQAFGEVDFKGTVKESKITFSFGTSLEGTNLTITYSGTVESADSMKGTVDFGGYGGGTFTGKRQ